MNASPSFAISQSDLITLRSFLEHEDAYNPLDIRERHQLVEQLRQAVVFDDDAADPPQVAGLQTLVTVSDLSSRPPDTFDFTLVLPHEANFEDDQISVLSPLGAAVLGQKAGTTVSVASPAGPRKLHLLAVLKKAAIH